MSKFTRIFVTLLVNI